MKGTLTALGDPIHILLKCIAFQSIMAKMGRLTSWLPDIVFWTNRHLYQRAASIVLIEIVINSCRNLLKQGEAQR